VAPLPSLLREIRRQKRSPFAVGGAGVDHNAKIESPVPHTPEMTYARDDASS
jgi:hypothetical protein